MTLEKVVWNCKKIKNSFFVLKSHNIQKIKLRLSKNTQVFTLIMRQNAQSLAHLEIFYHPIVYRLLFGGLRYFFQGKS